VPAAWVEATLQPSITIGKGPFRYGRHWWDGVVQHHGTDVRWTAGVGNGGHRLFVLPELDLVVVFTAGVYSEIDAQKGEHLVRTEFALFRQIVGAA